MPTHYRVEDQGDPRRYYTQVPNMVDDAGLSPYAFRLYVHLKRVAGDDGNCWQSTGTLASACKMSAGMVTKAKIELQDKGFITIKQVAHENPGRAYHIISIIDLWVENSTKYKQSSPHELQSSQSELQSSPHELKNNPIKNNPLRDSAAQHKRAPKPKDERTNHPAIQLIRGVTGKFPPKAIYDDIIKVLGDSPNGAKFSEVHKTWVRRGFNAGNFDGQLEWYRIGIPQNGNGKRATPSQPPVQEQTEEQIQANVAAILAARRGNGNGG